MFEFIKKFASPFLPLEKALLQAVVEELGVGAREKLKLQMASTRKVQRLLSWTEINLYSKPGKGPSGGWPKEALFQNRSDNLRFACIRFSVGGQQFTTHLHAVAGHVFSIVTRPSPKKIAWKQPEIRTVTILANPDDEGVDSDQPRDLPKSYLNFIRQQSLESGDWVIHEPSHVYRVDLEEGSYWLLAELGGEHFVLTPAEGRTAEVFVCHKGERPVRVASFQEALQLGSR